MERLANKIYLNPTKSNEFSESLIKYTNAAFNNHKSKVVIDIRHIDNNGRVDGVMVWSI